MAKSVYVGVGGVAKKVKNIYVGVEGKARKVIKAYVGVNGVAKLFYERKKEVGKVSNLSNYTYRCTRLAVIGDYVLLLSTVDSNNDKNYDVSYVETYNSSFTLGSASNLSKARAGMSIGNIGDKYVMIIGGNPISGNSVEAIDVIDVYDKSLTTKQLQYPDKKGIDSLSTCNFNNNCICAGGCNSDAAHKSEVYRYDTSLTYTQLTSLKYVASTSASSVVGDYALFATGTSTRSSSSYNYVTHYNSSFTHGELLNIISGRESAGGSYNSKYALFAGGSINYTSTSTHLSVVDTFDSSLTKGTAPDINTKGSFTYGHNTTIGDYAVFKPGGSGGKTPECYDSTLTKTILPDVSDMVVGNIVTFKEYILCIIFDSNDATHIERYKLAY